MIRASRWGAAAVALAATSWLVVSCHSEKRGDSLPDVDRALDLVVPRSATNVSAPKYDTGQHAVSAAREMDLGTSWSEYVPWVESVLASDWKQAAAASDGGDSLALHFGRSATGDAYLLSIERRSEGPPAHVRVTVLVVPD